MSNALCTTAQCSQFSIRAALAMQELINQPLTTLCAIGLCVLAVWIFYRVTSPEKFTLKNSPGRNLRVEPGMVIMLAVAVYFMQDMIGSMAYMMLVGIFPKDSPGLLAIPYSISRVAAIAGMIVIARYVFSLGIVRGLGLSLRHWIFDSARSVIAYFAVLPVCLLLLQLMMPFFTEAEKHPVLLAMKNASGPELMLLITASLVLAPIAEEILFRGFLQSALRKLTGSAWLGIAITSVIFTLSHAPMFYSMPPLLVLSVVLGYNYERSGRLVSPILIHMIFNGVFIAMELAELHAGG